MDTSLGKLDMVYGSRSTAFNMYDSDEFAYYDSEDEFYDEDLDDSLIIGLFSTFLFGGRYY
jgi:hypothetical protein